MATIELVRETELYLNGAPTETVDGSSMNLQVFSSYHDSSSLNQGLILRRLMMTVGVNHWGLPG